MKLDSSGGILDEFGANQFVVPHGLTISRLASEGESPRLWLTDTSLHRVIQLSTPAKQRVHHTLGQKRLPGDGAERFNKPTHVAVDSKGGGIFIADGYGNSRIAVFKRNDKGGYVYSREFGTRGSGPGQLLTPHGLALDGYGKVYVADRENGRIQVFSEDGAHLDIWEPGIKRFQNMYGDEVWRGFVCAIAFDPHLEVLFALIGDAVVMFDRHGHEMQRWGRAGKGDGELSFPHALAVGMIEKSEAGAAAPAVYVAELQTKRVQQFVARKTKRKRTRVLSSPLELAD